MNHPSNVIPLFTKTHRVVPPMRGEDMARAARDPDAVYFKRIGNELHPLDGKAQQRADIDAWLKRQRNQPKVSEGVWLLIGAVTALLAVVIVYGDAIDAVLS